MTTMQHRNALQALSEIHAKALCYIAAPYTARLADGSEDKVTVANRVREMSLCMEKLMQMGIKTATPLLMHLLRTYVNELPGDWAYWGEYSTIMLDKCEVMIVLMIDGWATSTGVTEEINLATAACKPIIYLDPVLFLAKA